MQSIVKKPFFKNETSQAKKPYDPTKYKTTLCHEWEAKGSCSYGDKCNFAHGESDKRTREENIKTSEKSRNILKLDKDFPPLVPLKKESEAKPVKISTKWADDEREFDPNQHTQELKQLLSVSTEKGKISSVEYNMFVGTIPEKPKSLEERFREIRLVDLPSLKEKDPILFGYCMGFMSSLKLF